MAIPVIAFEGIYNLKIQDINITNNLQIDPALLSTYPNSSQVQQLSQQNSSHNNFWQILFSHTGLHSNNDNAGTHITIMWIFLHTSCLFEQYWYQWRMCYIMHVYTIIIKFWVAEKKLLLISTPNEIIGPWSFYLPLAVV